MNFLSLLLFFTSIASVILGVIVYFLNRKNLLNRIFALTLWFHAYWASTQFMMLVSTDSQAAYIWDKSGFLAPFSMALLLHFGLVFTENEMLKDKKTYLLIYSPALVFSLFHLTTDLMTGPIVLGYWGFINTLPSNIWIWVLSKVWSASVAFFLLFLFAKYYFFGVPEAKKMQARYVVIGFSIPILTGIITDVVLPSFNADLPSISSLSTIMYSSLVVFALWKYNLFTLTPEIAAKSILDTVPDSIILTDLDGIILTVNRGGLVFFGYSQSGLVGKSIKLLFAKDQIGHVFLTNVSQEGIIRNFEAKCKMRNGKEQPVLFSVSLVTDDNGKGLGFVFTIRDITELKQMQMRLVKAERLASIGELAGMVGHDIRNPLQGIRLALYRLKTKYGPALGAEGKEICKKIDECVTRTDKIVNDLLDYSREIKLELEKSNPKLLLKKTLPAIQVPKKIKVINNTQDTPEVMVDSEKIVRVLINIVKNALEAMPRGGTLTITSKEVENKLEISFADTGEGMTEETLNRLWVPLFTTKAKGMGFGLSICKRLVEAHGGSISAKSTIGKGTTLTLRVPIVSEPLIENGGMVFDEESAPSVRASQ
jgi:PAS domain S-box-containing protein